MFEKLKHTFKQTAVYSLGNISTKIIGFVLLPIYTNPDYLSVEDYGVWVTLEITSQILIGVIALNLPVAMMRWAAEEEDKSGEIIFTTIVSLLGIIAISLAFLLPNSDLFSTLIFGKNSYTVYFSILFIVVAFGIYNAVPLNLLRLKEKSVTYVVASTVKFTTILLLNIYFVIFLNEGVEGIIKSQLFGEILLFIFTLPVVLKSIKARFETKIMFRMIKYGAPLVLSTVSSFILSFGDRFIMLRFLDKASVGIYSVGYKIASVINMLILQSFQLGFLPIAYKKLKEDGAERFFSKVVKFYTIVLMFSALSISMFGRELIELFAKDENYFYAIGVIPIISLGFVLKGIQYNFALAFHFTKQTHYNAFIVIVTAAVSLALNYFLIPLWGFVGAAYSFLFSVTFMTAISYWLGQKVFPVSYENANMLKIIFLGLLIFSLSGLFDDFSLAQRFLTKTLMLFFFVLFLFFINIFEASEKNRFLLLLKKIKKGG